MNEWGLFVHCQQFICWQLETQFVSAICRCVSRTSHHHSLLLLGPQGAWGEERLISGSTSPPGVLCSTGLAQNQRAAWANAGGQIGTDQGADTGDCRTGWDKLRADQLRPLYVCWYTRSVHMSTSIDLWVHGLVYRPLLHPQEFFWSGFILLQTMFCFWLLGRCSPEENWLFESLAWENLGKIFYCVVRVTGHTVTNCIPRSVIAVESREATTHAPQTLCHLPPNHHRFPADKSRWVTGMTQS